MKNVLRAGAAALAVAMTLPAPVSAGPPAPGPEALCGLVAGTAPGTSGTDVLTGTLSGAALGTGTLTCTVQVGASTHSGSDAASASASGGPVVVLPPTVVSFVAPEGIPVYLCKQWTDVAGGTVYWHDGDDTGEDGHWTADPNKPCPLVISVGIGGLVDALFGSKT